MKKEFSKKKLWGSVAVLLVLIAVLITLVGFGSGPDGEGQPSASPSPTLSIASSTASPAPTSKPAAKASPSHKVKAASSAVVEESYDAKEEAKNAVPPAEAKGAEKEPTSSSAGTSSSSSAPPAATPAAVGTEAPRATPVPTPEPTPKPKEKVWVVDVPASTQQIWVDEQSHWEDKTYLTSDWVYQCNGCGQTFPSTADVDAHQWAAFDNGEDHGGYTMVSGPMYEASEKVWVVDIEGHYETVTTPEQGHWEYK